MLMNKLISNSNRTKLSAILLLPLGPSLHGTISNVVSSEDMVLVSRTTRSELYRRFSNHKSTSLNFQNRYKIE